MSIPLYSASSYQDQPEAGAATVAISMPMYQLHDAKPTGQKEWFCYMRRYMARVNHFNTYEFLSEADDDLIYTYRYQTSCIVVLSILAAVTLVLALVMTVFFFPISWIGLYDGLCLASLVAMDITYYLYRLKTLGQIKARYWDLRAKLLQPTHEPVSVRYYLHPEWSNPYHIICQFLVEYGHLPRAGGLDMDAFCRPLHERTIKQMAQFFEQEANGELSKAFYQSDFQTQFNTILALMTTAGYTLEAQYPNPGDYPYVDIQALLADPSSSSSTTTCSTTSQV